VNEKKITNLLKNRVSKYVLEKKFSGLLHQRREALYVEKILGRHPPSVVSLHHITGSVFL
jgi:hypothetical protein